MKMTYTIILIALVIILAVAGIFYWVLKTNTTEVTKLEPYVTVMNKSLILDRDVLLVKNRKANVFKEPYLIVDTDVALEDEITEKHLIKAGHEITLKNAKLFTNGNSGLTASVVFGEIITDFGTISFEHIWGKQHVNFDVGTSDYFKFPQPIWESEEYDEEKRYNFKY